MLVVLALLGLNLYISSQALQPASRVAIPYYPTFITEVNNGNVSSISSTGNAVQGTFKAAVKYPPGSQTAKPTTLFSTQIPSFANGSSLQNLLQAHGVTINAHPLSTGPSFRLRTALSNKVRAGAPSRSPPGSGIASSTSGGTAVVRRLFKTSAAV